MYNKMESGLGHGRWEFSRLKFPSCCPTCWAVLLRQGSSASASLALLRDRYSCCDLPQSWLLWGAVGTDD